MGDHHQPLACQSCSPALSGISAALRSPSKQAQAKLKAAERARLRAATALDDANEERDASAALLQELEDQDGCLSSLWKAARAKSDALAAAAAASAAAVTLARAEEAVKQASTECQAAAMPAADGARVQ
jgi:hypothetical protein